MLQPSPSSETDRQVPYLRAGFLSSLDEVNDLPTMFVSEHDMKTYRVERGDLVVAEGGDVGRTAFLPQLPDDVIIQNSLHRVRSTSADIRFIWYVLDAIYHGTWLDVLCNRATFGHLTREKITSLPIPVQSVSSQRAIADYLDRETARIDALIEKKRRILNLLAERQGQLLTASMDSMGMRVPNSLDSNWPNQSIPPGWRVMHLNQCLRQLTNGFVGPTREILRDYGVRYVQSLHIKGGRIDFERSPFYVSEEWHRERPRIHLREGDVLIVQTGDIGQVAVVPAAFGEASCHALQIGRVRPELISGPFLGEYLRTPFAYQSLLKRATGALHPHLEGGIRDVPVVVPPLQLQEVLLQQVRRDASQAEALATVIRSQLQLLAEHRASVVVAAVTGQSRVPGVAA